MGEWLANVVGVAFLMLAENLFPPIPSEAILPLTGFLVGRGDLAFFPALVVATSSIAHKTLTRRRAKAIRACRSVLPSECFRR